MPNGTYGGVRGGLNSPYSIAFGTKLVRFVDITVYLCFSFFAYSALLEGMSVVAGEEPMVTAFIFVQVAHL